MRCTSGHICYYAIDSAAVANLSPPHARRMAPSIESPVATDVVHQIRIIRGQRVLLDADLATLYGVSTKVFNQAVRRNTNRFPSDFLLSLSNQDVASLRSQIVT